MRVKKERSDEDIKENEVSLLMFVFAFLSTVPGLTWGCRPCKPRMPGLYTY